MYMALYMICMREMNQAKTHAGACVRARAGGVVHFALFVLSVVVCVCVSRRPIV